MTAVKWQRACRHAQGPGTLNNKLPGKLGVHVGWHKGQNQKMLQAKVIQKSEPGIVLQSCDPSIQAANTGLSV